MIIAPVQGHSESLVCSNLTDQIFASFVPRFASFLPVRCRPNCGSRVPGRLAFSPRRQWVADGTGFSTIRVDHTHVAPGIWRHRLDAAAEIYSRPRMCSSGRADNISRRIADVRSDSYSFWYGGAASPLFASPPVWRRLLVPRL